MKIFGEHFMSKSGDKVGALNAKRSPSTMDDHNNEATIDDLTQQKIPMNTYMMVLTVNQLHHLR